MTIFKRLVLLVPLLLFLVPSASAETLKPWWHLVPNAAPSTLQREGAGQVVLTFVNFGDADVNGASVPVKIAATLPAGLKATSVTASAGTVESNVDDANRGPVVCPTAKELQEGASLSCSFRGTLPPYDPIVVTIGVNAESAVSGERVQASVSGGGAPSATLLPGVTPGWPITVSGAGEAAIGFGLQDNQLALEAAGGEPDLQAGSHPFQLADTLVFDQVLRVSLFAHELLPAAPALPKNIEVKLPPGVVGNPIPLAQCSIGRFLTHPKGSDVNDCPAQDAVGVVSILINEPSKGLLGFTVPLFNLEPSYGEPARFGFYIGVTETPVFIDTSVRGGPGVGGPGKSEEYAITGASLNTSQVIGLLSSEVVFWGVPGSPAHDNSRGWGCLAEARGETHQPCESAGEQHPPAFFTMPTGCSGGPLVSSTDIDSWADPAEVLPEPLSEGDAMQTLDGCSQLKFEPAVKAEPTTDSASSASGLKFNLSFHDEGLLSEESDAQSQMRDTVVALPAGFTIDPSAGVGLAGCTEADYEKGETLTSAPGAGCPNESKLGTIEVEVPLLSQKLEGNIFIAQPYENPFGSLVALYVVIKNPETGVMIKLAGKVTPCEAAGEDPLGPTGEPIPGVSCQAAGQLFTTFENEPQFPIGHFSFKFREGQQAPLITPATCGTYTTEALLTKFSEPLTPQLFTSSFTITSGAGGGACPAGNVVPFNPGITAYPINIAAGAYSPLYIHLTRGDSDQEISGFSTNMPPGLTGNLTGIPFCPEADIEAARGKTGAQEEANPSCPEASQIGHTLVGTGVGAVLAYVPGKVYLAGSFEGAPFSVVSITSAKVGPFDLGTVVLRFGLNINPYTAQVTVSPSSSEPIPTIIKGIVTHVRDIRVYIERPNNAPFTLNPTNCSPASISSTLTAGEGASSTISSPFQATNCRALAFEPKISISTQGKTSKANGASLTYKIAYPHVPQGTDADIHYVKVELPKALPSRLTTLQKACTAAQFDQNPAGCPAPSVIGHAKAIVPNIPVPVEGPVYFVSHGGEAFPSLEIVLQGYGVKIILVGSTFISKSGITSTTFKTVPDNPVYNFELTLPEGPYSALAANGNLCALTSTKTVKQKVTVKAKGHKKTVTKKVKETVAATLQMPNEYIAQNGATYNKTIPIKVTGCPKAKPAKQAKKKVKKGKGATKGHN